MRLMAPKRSVLIGVPTGISCYPHYCRPYLGQGCIAIERGASRLRRQLIFVLVGVPRLLCSVALMYWRLRACRVETRRSAQSLAKPALTKRRQKVSPH
jgi:hypothetical protein